MGLIEIASKNCVWREDYYNNKKVVFGKLSKNVFMRESFLVAKVIRIQYI